MNSRIRRIADTGAKGAVSIFIVVFSAILITTISVGFVRMMIQHQQQATDTDLSQSALDSAEAGVEDAKRLLVRYRVYCLGSPAAMTSPECTQLTQALSDSNRCDTIQRSGIDGSPADKEVIIQQSQSGADSELQQAYTCVKVQLDTSDYIGSLPLLSTKLIPLKSATNFNRVTVEWYSQTDLKESSTGSGSGASSISLSTTDELPRLADWPGNRPAIMRAQLIQFGSNFNLSDFDGSNGAPSNAHTLFLMPSLVGRGADDTPLNFADDARAFSPSGSLQQVACDQSFSLASTDKQFACRAVIDIPNAIGQADGARVAYLRLNALYGNKVNFRVTLANNTGVGVQPVSFNNVQPIVDSTGRANSLFRRVQSRVELDNSSFPFPDSGVELVSGLCKAFLVTDKDYRPSGDCANF